MEPVLPIAYVAYDESVEETGDVSNMSAEQYMSWVRNQSHRLPLVFRSEKTVTPVEQTKTMPEIENVYKCQDEFLPDIEWERETIHNFALLRQLFESQDTLKDRKVMVPQLKDRIGWLQFCLGDEVVELVYPKTSTTSESTLPQDNSSSLVTTQPSDEEIMQQRKAQLATSLGINFITCEDSPNTSNEQKIEMVSNEENDNMEETEAAEDDDETIESDPITPQPHLLTDPGWTGLKEVSPTIDLILQFDQVLTQKVLQLLIDFQELLTTYHPVVTFWMYSLLARMEKPIHRDMVAGIRQLYRRCCKLRYFFISRHHQQTLADNNKHLPQQTSPQKEEAEEEANLMEISQEEDGEIVEESNHKNDNEEEEGVVFAALDKAEQEELAGWNLLIAITGYYFGQGEQYQDFVHYQDYLVAIDDHTAPAAQPLQQPLQQKEEKTEEKMVFSKEDFMQEDSDNSNDGEEEEEEEGEIEEV